MKAGTESKAKFLKLQRRLGLRKYECAGLLEMLWQVTARDAPRGDIGRLSNEDIAATVDWPGDEDQLIRDLVDTGWLDESAQHRLVVHDWHNHAPRYVKGIVSRNGDGFATECTTELPTESATVLGTQLPTECGCNSTLEATKPSVAKPSVAKPSVAKPKEERAVPSGAPKKGATLSRFQKPTVEEVRAYCKARGSPVDAQQFWDFYEAKGWRVGNQPMKDWHACVRTWESRTRKEEAQKPSSRRGDAMTAEECLEAEVRSVLAKRGIRDEAEVQRWLARARKERGL